MRGPLFLRAEEEGKEAPRGFPLAPPEWSCRFSFEENRPVVTVIPAVIKADCGPGIGGCRSFKNSPIPGGLDPLIRIAAGSGIGARVDFHREKIDNPLRGSEDRAPEFIRLSFHDFTDAEGPGS